MACVQRQALLWAVEHSSRGVIPPTDFTVYFNITICHVANYTTLNDYIVLVNWKEAPLLKRIKVKFQQVWCYCVEKKIKTHAYPTFFAIPQLRNALQACVHFLLFSKNLTYLNDILYFIFWTKKVCNLKCFLRVPVVIRSTRNWPTSEDLLLIPGWNCLCHLDYIMCATSSSSTNLNLLTWKTRGDSFALIC